MPICPGEGVLTPREIFSFRARRRVTSASKVSSLCCSWLFILFKFTMCVVAEGTVHEHERIVPEHTKRTHRARGATPCCSSG